MKTKDLITTPFVQVSDNIFRSVFRRSLSDIPFLVERIHLKDKVFFRIRPNNTSFEFCFNTLRGVYYFVSKYSNSHTDKYWFWVYDNNPMFHFSVVLKDLLSFHQAIS